MTVLSYSCLQTEYITLYNVVNTQRDGLRQTGTTLNSENMHLPVFCAEYYEGNQIMHADVQKYVTAFNSGNLNGRDQSDTPEWKGPV